MVHCKSFHSILADISHAKLRSNSQQYCKCINVTTVRSYSSFLFLLLLHFSLVSYWSENLIFPISIENRNGNSYGSGIIFNSIVVIGKGFFFLPFLMGIFTIYCTTSLVNSQYIPCPLPVYDPVNLIRLRNKANLERNETNGARIVAVAMDFILFYFCFCYASQHASARANSGITCKRLFTKV